MTLNFSGDHAGIGIYAPFAGTTKKKKSVRWLRNVFNQGPFFPDGKNYGPHQVGGRTR